ncbi:hypothetical protein V8C86DRAFT_116837 [Haematococcus lacustris]
MPTSKYHPYKGKGGHAARCALCVKTTPAGLAGWVEIHVEGEAASYRSGQSVRAIGQVTTQMAEIIKACDNLVPALIPLAHMTCAEFVKETRRFFESSLLVMWREFDDEHQHLEEQWGQNQHQQGGQLQQPPSMRVSLSTFVRLRPPWVARLTASQRQVCVCKTCCNLDNLLTALAQHKKSLQLPPVAAIAAPLVAPLAL